MTREEAKKAAEVMSAFAEGKKIEYKVREGDEWRPINELDTPLFDWNSTEYRIKKEPTYRPFTNAQECWEEMHKHSDFGWVRRGTHYLNIGELNITFVLLEASDDVFVFEDAFNKFTFIDGSPFGFKEE